MKKLSSLHSLLPMAVLFALFLAAINPSMAFAEGETPETSPDETSLAETLQQENNGHDTVEDLADNQVVIVDQNNSIVPLA
jgi:hypothetical protein